MMHVAPGQSGLQSIPGLGGGEVAGDGQKALGVYFKGRTPEVEGTFFISRLGHSGQVGRPNQVRITAERQVGDIGLNPPERQKDRVWERRFFIDGGQAFESALFRPPDGLTVLAVKGQGVTLSVQVPSAMRAKRGQKLDGPVGRLRHLQ